MKVELFLSYCIIDDAIPNGRRRTRLYLQQEDIVRRNREPTEPDQGVMSAVRELEQNGMLKEL